jgi:hypothetical protein
VILSDSTCPIVQLFEVLLDHCRLLAEGLLELSECASSAVTPGNNRFENRLQFCAM